ncbi:hypothetical protein cypCar_00021881 [Cyprinus carpio]|nr:hypothetical protein cypCar_00021881 [Cyprinus carpio]
MTKLLSVFGVDFVTWRGHLTKVLTTPYETQEGWMLAASKFRGTIYISEVETEAARVHRETRSERQEEMMCWGYKSEQYLCAGLGTLVFCSVRLVIVKDLITYQSFFFLLRCCGWDSRPRGIVNTNEAFCTVVQTRLADHKLLFSGEVERWTVKDPDALTAPGCYVELKTSTGETINVASIPQKN